MSDVPTANYAENLITERLRGFRFQPRAGSLNMKAISRADVSQIIRRGDHAGLQLLLNNTNIIKAHVSGEDFDFHSSDFLLKLFQICQLSLELSYTKNTMLATELVEVNRNFQRKTAEANSNLAKNLRRQDEEIAMLRDELYHCKEALKKAVAEEQLRIDHGMFPSQERRVVNSSEFSGDDDDVSIQSISIDATEIKLHIVSPSHGLYIQLIVDETCTIRNLQNKIMVRCFLGDEGEVFEQWSLYYKDQELQSTLTLKENQIKNDSALVILPTSPVSKEIVPILPNTIESKLDEIKSMLNQVTHTLECQVAIQESNTELLVKGMGSCNEMLEEMLRTEAEASERIGNATAKLTEIDVKTLSSEANADEQNVSQPEMKQTIDMEYVADHLEAKTRSDDVGQGIIRHEKMELTIDTIETNDAVGDEWPFGLNFDTAVGPPTEINVTKNTADGDGGSLSNGTNGMTTKQPSTKTTAEDVKSPPKADCCDCSAGEVCDECVNPPSPRSSEAAATTDTQNNVQVDEQQFTFSAFEDETADYDYSCDKSDFESLQIGAKESNVVTDSDLQSIEMSLEEFALGLEASEGKKKKSRFLKKLTCKPRWLKSKKKATPVVF